ncbi:hypothetical protein EJB05_01119, partial [Eragrostis curvula]
MEKRAWLSSTFEAAGSSWRIAYSPYGNKQHPLDNDEYVSLYLQLDPDRARSDQVEMAKIKFSLLDQSILQLAIRELAIASQY